MVCLVDTILIHASPSLELLHTIRHIPANPADLMALSASSEPFCCLAYPASNTTGVVNLFEASRLEHKRTIAAHDNPLVALTVDSQGTKLATASNKVSALCDVESLLAKI